MKARNTEIIITGGSFNYAPHITEFKYSDSIESEADTVEMTLADNEKKLLSAGAIPERGTEFSFSILKKNWNSLALEKENALSLNLGSFQFDELDCSGPPSKLVLKFTSVPLKSGSRGVNRDFAFEDTTLLKIAGDIAARAGLNLSYDAPEIEIKRAEQSGLSDFAFLESLCKKNSLNMKVHNKQLIIFDAEKFEAAEPVITLTPDLPIILHYNFKVKSTDIYEGANVSFLQNGIFDIAGAVGDMFGIDFVGTSTKNASGNVLNINSVVRSNAEGERLSKAALREKNKNEFKLNLNLSGSFSFVAGNTFTVSGFNSLLDGKYIVVRSTHAIDAGYTTSVNAHKVLQS